MPLPRYQPVRKRQKLTTSPTIDDLDDNCLAQIIGHVLALAKQRDAEPFVGDNTQAEKSLSLVSKRWYFLTQTQICEQGVLLINLDDCLESLQKLKIRVCGRTPFGKATVPTVTRPPAAISAFKTPRRLFASNNQANSFRSPSAIAARRAGVLVQRNGLASQMGNQQQQQAKSNIQYDIQLFRAIRFKLMKYKHVQIKGSISMDNFIKLIVVLNSTKTQRLDILNLKIDKSSSPSMKKLSLPNCLPHLEVISVVWSVESRNDIYTNELIWSLFEQSAGLRALKLYCTGKNDITTGGLANDIACRATEEMYQRTAFTELLHVLARSSTKQSHCCLSELTFIKTPLFDGLITEKRVESEFSDLIKFILSNEPSINRIETNDCTLIQHLIDSSTRLCTRYNLRWLNFTSPLKDLNLLHRLIKLNNLGTDYLSIALDDIDSLPDIINMLDEFKAIRAEHANCRVNLHLKDQKLPDCEDKVKNLTNLSLLANVNVFISALQRISIDCCHLMWSTGRALQNLGLSSSVSGSGHSINGTCIFKLTLQTYPSRPNVVNPCEITVPFGPPGCLRYKINSSREDLARHREIMKSLKRDCYHQFVKSVRDNIGP